MKYLVVACLFLNFGLLQAQKTIPLKLKKFRVAYLEDKLIETSGLCLFSNKAYTFNDGGNSPILYELNLLNGTILSTKVLNCSNRDWEAITTDSTSIFMGDFGNNEGVRKDLTIYNVKFDTDSVLSVASKIEFAYLHQSDFSSRNLKHDFDAEAMIFFEGKIHLFSKEWQSKKTSHYVIDPNTLTKQILQPTEAFKTKFLVTDAAYFDSLLYLVGYTKKGRTFLMVFSKDSSSNFFSSKPRKYKLGSLLTIGQIEGITVNEKGIYISGEGINKSIVNIQPALYFIPHSILKNAH